MALVDSLQALVAALPIDLRAHGEEVMRAILTGDPECFRALSDEPSYVRWLRELRCDAASDALHAYARPYIPVAGESSEPNAGWPAGRIAAWGLLITKADRACELVESDPAERGRHAARVPKTAATYVALAAKAVA